MTKEYTFYRIFNLNLEECYVGSTTNYKQRIAGHKSGCNNPYGPRYNTKVYKFIRENGGFKNWQFEIIEEQILNHKEALNIESEFIMIYSASLNTDVPGRTKKEGDKQYRLNNKEIRLEQSKQYYKNNIDKLKQYRIDNKEKLKEGQSQYRLKNKDKINQYARQYRLKNKDKINEYTKQWRLDYKDKSMNSA